jgi:hypothetical protein
LEVLTPEFPRATEEIHKKISIGTVRAPPGYKLEEEKKKKKKEAFHSSQLAVITIDYVLYSDRVIGHSR